ncbi:MAG: UbiD family decarboxylase [Actinomycetia bacterium]|nr:UbiD family decarboxylase [Actinomycetes bacterium]
MNIAKTPDGSWTNWSINRMMIASRNTLAGLIPGPQHLGIIRAQWAKEGKPLPIALALGAEPGLPYVGAMTPSPNRRRRGPDLRTSSAETYPNESHAKRPTGAPLTGLFVPMLVSPRLYAARRWTRARCQGLTSMPKPLQQTAVQRLGRTEAQDRIEQTREAIA